MPDLVRTLWLQILSRHTNHDWGFRQSYELLRRSTARALSFREGVGQYMEAMLERSDPVNPMGYVDKGFQPGVFVRAEPGFSRTSVDSTESAQKQDD